MILEAIDDLTYISTKQKEYTKGKLYKRLAINNIMWVMESNDLYGPDEFCESSTFGLGFKIPIFSNSYQRLKYMFQ